MEKNNDPKKPCKITILPEPWVNTKIEIVAPLIWLGTIKKGQAERLGVVVWFAPLIFIIEILLGYSDQVIGAVIFTWIFAALYASWILQRINFDIKEEI